MRRRKQRFESWHSTTTGTSSGACSANSFDPGALDRGRRRSPAFPVTPPYPPVSYTAVRFRSCQITARSSSPFSSSTIIVLTNFCLKHGPEATFDRALGMALLLAFHDEVSFQTQDAGRLLRTRPVNWMIAFRQNTCGGGRFAIANSPDHPVNAELLKMAEKLRISKERGDDPRRHRSRIAPSAPDCPRAKF